MEVEKREMNRTGQWSRQTTNQWIDKHSINYQTFNEWINKQLRHSTFNKWINLLSINKHSINKHSINKWIDKHSINKHSINERINLLSINKHSMNEWINLLSMNQQLIQLSMNESTNNLDIQPSFNESTFFQSTNIQSTNTQSINESINILSTNTLHFKIQSTLLSIRIKLMSMLTCFFHNTFSLCFNLMHVFEDRQMEFVYTHSLWVNRVFQQTNTINCSTNSQNTDWIILKWFTTLHVDV